MAEGRFPGEQREILPDEVCSHHDLQRFTSGGANLEHLEHQLVERNQATNAARSGSLGCCGNEDAASRLAHGD